MLYTQASSELSLMEKMFSNVLSVKKIYPRLSLSIINIATCFLSDRIDFQNLKFGESARSYHPKRNQHLDVELKEFDAV